MAIFDALRQSAAAMDVLATTHAQPAAIAQRQKSRLAALLKAAQGSTYYRALWAAAGIELDDPAFTIEALPVVEKHGLMPHFDDWVTDPELRLRGVRDFLAVPGNIAQPYLGRYHVWESSGTTGSPGYFIQDAQALAVYDALEALRRDNPRPLLRWMDPWFTTERLAFVGALGGHFASHVSMQRLQALNPMMARALRSFSILDPLPELVRGLEDYQPTVIASYPTAAVMLAEATRHGRLAISPREVWTGGETLSPGARACIEQAWGCSVRNSYGASEFLTLGWECREGQMHLNADWALLEPVDAQHRPVPVGQTGHTTLLTSLANKVQPLIRYELGDQVRYTGVACTCGCALPVIEVQGRRDDALVMAGRDGLPVTLLPLALSTVLEEEAGVFDFQLSQRDAHTLSLRVGGEPRESAEALKRGCHALKDYAQRQGIASLRVLPDAQPPDPRSRSGKAHRIVACSP